MADKLKPIEFNRESDFKLMITLHGEAASTSVPFRLVFSTPCSGNTYVVSYVGGVATNCQIVSDKVILAVFDNHRLGTGTLRVREEYYLTDADFADGICNTVSKSEVHDKDGREIVLTNGITDDMPTEVDADLFPFYQKGDKGDPFTYDDFTPEQIEGLKKPATDAAKELDVKFAKEATKLFDDYLAKVAALKADYDEKAEALKNDYESKTNGLLDKYEQLNSALKQDYNITKGLLSEDYTAVKADLDKDYQDKLAALYNDYTSTKMQIASDYDLRLELLKTEYQRLQVALASEYRAKQEALEQTISEKQTQLENTVSVKMQEAVTTAGDAAKKAETAAGDAGKATEEIIKLKDNLIFKSNARTVEFDKDLDTEAYHRLVNRVVDLERARAILEGHDLQLFNSIVQLNSALSQTNSQLQQVNNDLNKKIEQAKKDLALNIATAKEELEKKITNTDNAVEEVKKNMIYRKTIKTV